MKLWLVDANTWGTNLNIVRAETEEDARRVAREPVAEVTELKAEGGEAILWSYEHSPDTPRD